MRDHVTIDGGITLRRDQVEQAYQLLHAPPAVKIKNLTPVRRHCDSADLGVVISGPVQRAYVREERLGVNHLLTVVTADGNGNSYVNAAHLLDSWEVVPG